MTVRMTISMTEEHAEQVETLVSSGEYASSSEVLRHGLRLLAAEREQKAHARAEHEERLNAIRADLKERLKGPFMTREEGTKWLEEQRRNRDSDQKDV